MHSVQNNDRIQQFMDFTSYYYFIIVVVIINMLFKLSEESICLLNYADVFTI